MHDADAFADDDERSWAPMTCADDDDDERPSAHVHDEPSDAYDERPLARVRDDAWPCSSGASFDEGSRRSKPASFSSYVPFFFSTFLVRRPSYWPGVGTLLSNVASITTPSGVVCVACTVVGAMTGALPVKL